MGFFERLFGKKEVKSNNVDASKKNEQTIKTKKLIKPKQTNEISKNENKKEKLPEQLTEKEKVSLKNKVEIIANEGISAYQNNNLVIAKEKFQLCIELYNKIGDKKNANGMVGNLGSVLFEMGEMTNSFQQHKKALDTALSNNYIDQATMAARNIGMCFNHANNFEKAIPFLTQSLTLAGQINDGYSASTASYQLAETYGKLENYSEAIRFGEATLQLYDSFEYHPQIAKNQENMRGLLISWKKLFSGSDSDEKKEPIKPVVRPKQSIPINPQKQTLSEEKKIDSDRVQSLLRKLKNDLSTGRDVSLDSSSIDSAVELGHIGETIIDQIKPYLEISSDAYIALGIMGGKMAENILTSALQMSMYNGRNNIALAAARGLGFLKEPTEDVINLLTNFSQITKDYGAASAARRSIEQINNRKNQGAQ